MKDLQVLLNLLTKARKLHISILDISGILNTTATKITFDNSIHSKEFCNIAKSTEKGYRLCLYCKKLANTKATIQKKPFCGHCAYGIYEVAVPVIINGAVAAIIYVGNAVIDSEYTKNRIERVCSYTKVDSSILCEQMSECEQISDNDELFNIAEIICDYIKMLYNTKAKTLNQMHWLVSAIREYAQRNYCFNHTLKDLSVIYCKSEKYMGRLFKSEMKMSYHEYCLLLKLQKAEKMLNSSSKIIDVALECGFNNISYFNRAFKRQYGMSPSQYIISQSR